MLTGQAVDTFDKLFQDLYVMSNGVNLSKINLDNEPTPEPAPQIAPTLMPSSTMALKLINPKYALVSGSITTPTSPERCAAKIGSIKQMKEMPETPPVHPGLLHLEKANMIEYLPVWPEPDPPSNVIGFINIRDYSKPMQAHLTRSELFEVSQAIQFKDSFQVPEEPIFGRASLKPEVEFLKDPSGLTIEQQVLQPQTSSMPNAQASVFLSPSNKSNKDSVVAKDLDSLLMQRSGVHASSQSSAKTIPSSASGEQHDPQQMPMNQQPAMSFCSDESKPSLLEPKTLGPSTSSAQFETTTSRPSFDEAPEIPKYDTNFSSASDEYFECSDTLTVDSGFKGMVNGMLPGSWLSQPVDSNNAVTHSQASVSLHLQQLAVGPSSYKQGQGCESLNAMDGPQHQHATEKTVHCEPDTSAPGPVIQADRLSEPLSKADQLQIEETDDARSSLLRESEPVGAPLKANMDAHEVSFEEKVEGLNKHPIVTKPGLLESESLSSSLQQGKVSSPLIVVQTKTESQSIVFSDRLKEVPLPKLKTQLHPRLKDTSKPSLAIKMKDGKSARHQQNVAFLRAVFEDTHVDRAQTETRKQTAQLTDTEEELFTQDGVKAEGAGSFVPELKENPAEQTVNIKVKTEPKGQKALAGTNAHSSASKQKVSLEVLSTNEPVWEHTCTYREQRNQPDADPKLEGGVRKLLRASTKTPQEARAGSAKPSATKLHHSNHPIRPAVPTSGAPNLHGQSGQNRAVNALPTLPDKLSTRRSAPTRSSQSPLRRTQRTEPSSPKQPQAQQDKSRTILLGRSSSRLRSASTSDDSHSSADAAFLRRSRVLKEKAACSHPKKPESNSSIKEKEQK